MRKKILTLLFAIIASVGINYASIKVDGVYYNLIGNNQASVTCKVPSSDYHNWVEQDYKDSLVIPQSFMYEDEIYVVTEIGKHGLAYCPELTSVTLPNSILRFNHDDIDADFDIYYQGTIAEWNSIQLEEYSHGWFNGWIYINNEKIEDLILPDDITMVNRGAFHGYTKLQSVTVGNNITKIWDHAFSSCYNLRSAILDKQTDTIRIHAFSGCKNLRKIVLGKEIKNIEIFAFGSCTYLTDVWAYMQPPTIDRRVFDDCGDLHYINLHVPAEYAQLYHKLDVWKDFNIIEDANEAVVNIEGNNIPSFYKVICNGQIFILRGDRTYTLTGQEVK